MKPLPVLAAAVLLACGPRSLRAGAGGVLLARNHEAFLVEDDLVYARCLDLLRDGTYRQINRDEHGSEEVDHGTWEQSAGGMLRLHATRHALRFHALVAGPLSVALNSQAQRDALPTLYHDIAGFLATADDAVFSTRDVADLVTNGIKDEEPCRLDISRQTETCSRGDVIALTRQIANFVHTEQSGVYVLAPTKTAAGQPVFMLADDTFQATDLPRVQREYGIPVGGRPPFYFVPVEARAFAREIGSWRVPRLIGSPE